MPHSQGPPFPSAHGRGDSAGDEPLVAESRRLTPSIGLAHDSDSPRDSSNEDFLFHLYRGSELLQDNRVHEAKEELERAIHLQPRDSKGQDLLAVVYFRLGLYPRAIQIYEQLRRRNTSDTALLLNLALCYLKTGQPQNARRDLEQLLALNPNHSRAWGYLGLACERLGDLAQAERAFAQGGHQQMARRIAGRRDASPDASPEFQPTQEVRDVAGAAYQELDAGELSFALAQPTSDPEEETAQSWRPHELGQVRASGHAPERAPSALPDRPDTRKPDTRDGPPPMVPSVPQLGPTNQSPNRRPTLIAPLGAPPAHELIASEYAAVERIPSQRPPSFSFEEVGALASPSLRRPVVAVPSPFGPPRSHDAVATAHGTHTLPAPVGGKDAGATKMAPPVEGAVAQPETTSIAPSTPLGIGPSVAPSVSPEPGVSPEPSARPETARVPSAPRPAPASEPRRTDSVRFPESGVVLHPSGVALVHTTSEAGFAVRLESIRAQQSGIDMKLLERQTKGKSTGESFGGIASPMALASGEGQLVLAARPGRRLEAFMASADQMCFAREDVLLGFGGGLAYENGRLATGEGEWIPVVQLRGEGAVLFEAIGEVLTLSVRATRSLSVRREVILGWFGRLVPRVLAPGDAPCGQRGLVSFAGEGRVLVASA